VVSEDPAALDGTATLQDILIGTVRPDCVFHLLMLTPHAAATPVACFLGANSGGNHTVLANTRIVLLDCLIYPTRASRGEPASPADRGRQADSWDVRATIDAGYAFATFCCGEVVPDSATAARQTLRGFSVDGRDTAAVMTWAWALARALDVVGNHESIDPSRVIAVGHSRLGKAALVAGAFDPRFAAVIASQSGCGGAAPSRIGPELAVITANGRPTAETPAVITSTFPHWFSPRWREHAADVDKLPFDQHHLLALCAPRPLLLANATDDAWTDPDGQFEMLQAAEPAYRLLRGDQTGTLERPRVDEISAGPLAYALRAGRHSMIAADWPVWRDFADRWVR